MKYTARKPFRYGSKIYMAGDGVSVDGDDVKMLQGQGKLGAPIMEKPKVETAMKEPIESAMKPKAEPRQDYTVVEIRAMLKERDLPTYGTKAELLERLEGD